MKKVFSILSITMALFGVMSCEKEGGKDSNASNHELSLAAYVSGTQISGVTTYDLAGGQQRTIDIRTSIKDLGAYDIKVTYGADDSLVTAYNAEHNTSYTLLPSEAYSFEPAQVAFELYNANTPVSVLTITAPELAEAASFLLPVVITNVETKDAYTVNTDASVVYFVVNVSATDPNGAGTAERPYKLRTADDLVAMEEKLVEGTEIFFAMENDIDMASCENWVPVNLDSPYNLIINFDGKGHKISNFTCVGKANASFFGVLNGTIQNVTFYNAFVNSTTNGGAVVAANAGKGKASGVKAHIKNVQVINSTNASARQMQGILCGCTSDCLIEQIYIENCSIKSESGKPRYTGFIAGIDVDATNPTIIRNCWVKGGEIDGNQQVAGIFGRSLCSVTIENCGTSAKLVANDAACAGILGQGSSGDKVDTVKGCVVWASEITTTSEKVELGTKYSSGAVVGACVGNKYVLNTCVYKLDLSFTDGRYPDNTLTTSADVDNAAPSRTSNYAPWFGKPSTAATASAAAKSLGWDETIWDLSGDEPKLK